MAFVQDGSKNGIVKSMKHTIKTQLNKKAEIRKFKALKKKAEMFANANDYAETLPDAIMDELAYYMDLHFGGSDFMAELCK